MTSLSLDLLLQDLQDRFATYAIGAGLPDSINNRLSSGRRMYYAIEEAIKFFIATSPAEALPGYLALADSLTGVPSEGLSVYPWPEDAAVTRPDGGLINVIIDSEEFIHFPITDPRIIQLELASLQMQAKAPLLYGNHFRNYLIDLNTKRIYAPSDRDLAIRYIRQHTPFDYTFNDDPGSSDPWGYFELPDTIPIDATYLDQISRRALAQLVRHASLPQSEADAQGEPTPEQQRTS